MSEEKNYILAENDYVTGMKYKDIATKYGVSINTVKSWKKRYKWSRNKKTGYKKGCTQNKKGAHKNEAVVEEVNQVIKNDRLTDKQRLFCVYYVRCFNATKAYQKAYECNYETAVVNGSRMLGNAKVKEEIYKLKQDRLNREFLSEEDIFQKYMDIAFSDITDYVSFGTEETPVIGMNGPVNIENPKTGEKEILKQKTNYVRVKDSSAVDGTIISEVKQGRDGLSIKLADRMKALQWLTDHMDMATAEQRAKIEQIKANTGTSKETDAVMSWMEAVKEARGSDE